jgi:hypothetical protein
MRALWLYVLSVPILMGCGLILDFDPPDLPPDMDAGSGFDAFVDVDSSNSNTDAMASDASGDSAISRPDGDVRLDGSVPDGSRPDGSSPDAGWPDAGRTDGCEDELGLCLEVSEFDPARDAIHWRHNVVWTLPGGMLFTTEWAAELCIGGMRYLAEGQTQCLIPIHDPGREVVGSAVVYTYPVMDDFQPYCTDTGCPGFPSAFRVWHDAVEIPVDAVIGLATIDRRTDTPHGTRFCLRITL